MFVGRSMREQAEARPQRDKSRWVDPKSKIEVDILLVLVKSIKYVYIR
jgi:hypothetical protein